MCSWRQSLGADDPQTRLQALHEIASAGPAAQPILSEIVSRLGDSDVEIRVAAADALAAIGADTLDAIVPLLKMENGPDDRVRQAAELAIERLLNIATDRQETLKIVMADPESAVRAHAIEHVAAGDAGSWVGLVSHALKDPSTSVRAAAAQKLSELAPEGRDRAMPLLLGELQSSDPGVRELVIRTLESSTPIRAAELGPVIEAAGSEYKEVRRYATKAIASLVAAGTRVTEALCQRLTDEEPDIRMAAAFALGQAGEAAVPALKRSLRSVNSEARGLAAFALGQMGAAARDAVPELITALDDWSPRVRANAASALGFIGKDSALALPALATALRDRDGRTVQAALEAIIQIGPKSFVGPALVGVLAHEDREISRLAGVALAKLPRLDPICVPELQQALLSSRADVRMYAVQALAMMGAEASDALPELRRALEDPDVNIRRQAYRVIAGMGNVPGAAAALAAALENDDATITGLTLAELQGRGALKEDAVPALTHALSNPSLRVREIAANCLGKVGPGAHSAAPALAALLIDRDASVRRASATALGQIGGRSWRAIPALGSALHDRDSKVRRSAIHSLAVMSPQAPNAVPFLLEAIRQPELRREAFAGIVATGRAAVPSLIWAVDNRDDYDMRIAAMAALGRLGSEAREAADTLAPLAFQHPYPGLRREAADALRRVRGQLPAGLPETLPISLDPSADEMAAALPRPRPAKPSKTLQNASLRGSKARRVAGED
jgi:HEAT repeat protein